MSDTTNTTKRARARRPQHKRHITVMQANVAKTGAFHDAALNRAWDARIDAVLLQEPWTTTRPGRRITKTHPGYEAFSPLEDWTDRPRVITYIRKDPSLKGSQIHRHPNKDMLTILLNGITLCNIYRQSHTDGVLRLLETWDIPTNTVILGDFNAVHWTWQPNHPPHDSPGSRVADWAMDKGLETIVADQPTNLQGNTIDLVFSNIPGTEGGTEAPLYTGSDHLTILTTVPTSRTPPPRAGKLQVHEDDTANFIQLCRTYQHLIPRSWETKEDLEDMAKTIFRVLTLALAGAGRTKQNQGHGTTWWSPDCSTALQECKTALANYAPPEEVLSLRRKFKHTAEAAKKQYWDNKIGNATSDSEIFAITGWHKLTDNFRSPALDGPDGPVTDTEDKIRLLRDKILIPNAAGDDIPDPWADTPPPRDRPMPWDHHVSMDEAETNCVKAGNTAPGKDGITARLLQAAWPAMGGCIRILYDGCIRAGYYPMVFRDADVVFLPKVGKSNFTLIKSWRPISLLSCLSKGLDRILARRMSTLAITEHILNDQHFGALPKRAATDLVACVVHDVEQAFSRGHNASLLTADVSGAFNAVLKNRLVHRLRMQGWPHSLVTLIHDFMTDRTASTRMEDSSLPTTPLACGVPQGSPISPILFLLYMQPLLTRGDTTVKFGYADDIAFLRTGKDTLETTAALSRDALDFLQWGRENAVSFDPAKCELIHFNKAGRWIPTKVKAGDFVVTPSTIPIRWLGIWLDPKLSFKPHAEIWGAKATRVASHLRSLNKVMKGSPASSTAKAGAACVIPVATYGADIWWPGLVKPSAKVGGKLVDCKVEGHVARLDRAIKTTARAVLPVWKTTPIPILHRESGLPPAKVILEQIRLRASLRLRSLDPLHPLTRRLATPLPPSRGGGRPTTRPALDKSTRLQRTSKLTPPAERPIILTRRWRTKPLPPLLSDKPAATKHHLQWLKHLPLEHTIIYTDGSKGEHVGWGVVAYQRGEQIYQQHGTLQDAEVYDGESHGAWQASEWALTRPPGTFHFCIDNTGVIQRITRHPSDNSQAVQIRFRDNVDKLQDWSVQWSPGHMDIQGNEAADKEAGLGSKGDPPHPSPDLTSAPPSNNQVNPATLERRNKHPNTQTPEPRETQPLPTLSHVRATNRQLRQHQVDGYWNRNEPASYVRWELPWKKHPKELSLTRTMLHRLLAERSGHGDFEPYHWRFGHPERSKKCKCGNDRTPGHAMVCPRVSIKLREAIPANEDPVKWLLREKGFRDFEWMVKTLDPYAAPDSSTNNTASLLRSRSQGPSEL